jgi:hypothetical protein
MNVLELWRHMDIDDIASHPKDLCKIIKKEDGLFWVSTRGEVTNEYVALNSLLLEDTDWEIDIPFVDFWTAYQATRDEGWAIKWEGAEVPYTYDRLITVSLEMLNGKWQILN